MKQYTIVKFRQIPHGRCLTKCPFKTTMDYTSDIIRVGSIACSECRYFRGYKINKSIKCSNSKVTREDLK